MPQEKLFKILKYILIIWLIVSVISGAAYLTLIWAVLEMVDQFVDQVK